jgi:hypothetical protein
MNLLCPHTESKAKTVHVDAPVKIGFNNTSGGDVSLYWIDPAGKEVFQKHILPRQVVSQDTFLGHVFRLRSRSGGHTLLEHTVGLMPVRNDAKIIDFPTDIPHSTPNASIGRETHDKPVEGGFEVGFVNRAGGFLKLYFYFPQTDFSELVAQLNSGYVYPQYTYKGHEFRVYTGDGRLVTSLKVGNIIVPSCIDHDKVQHRNQVQKLIANAVDCVDVWDEVDRDRDLEYEEDHQSMFECFSGYCAQKPLRVPRKMGGFLERYETSVSESSWGDL